MKLSKQAQDALARPEFDVADLVTQLEDLPEERLLEMGVVPRLFLARYIRKLERTADPVVGKLKVSIDHPTNMETGKTDPALTGGTLRLMDKAGTPALEVRVGTAQTMGQNQWAIDLRIEVGDVVVTHTFYGRFEYAQL